MQNALMKKVFFINLFLFLSAISNYVLAMDPPYFQSVSTIVNGVPFTVKDPYFDGVDRSKVKTNLSVRNVLSFEIRNDNAVQFYHNTPFTCTLRVKIEKWNWSNVKSEEEVDLTVQYTNVPGQSFKGVAYYKFENAYKVTITPITPLTSTELGSTVPQIFNLKQEIYIDRKFNFDPLINTLMPQEDAVTEPSKLKLSWLHDGTPGAEEFDLEWAFFDDNSGVAKLILAGQTAQVYNQTYLEQLFRNNASRVTLLNQRTSAPLEYKLNMVFPKGYLLYRIRGVQYNESNERIEGVWAYSKPASGGGQTFFSYRVAVSHQADFNWQYSAAYAEEGKKKEIVSYFDGALKSRQSVTLSNTTDKAVIQENIYDALGRPAVNVLPSPVNNNLLTYQHDFTQSGATSSAYSYTDLAINPLTGKLKASPLKNTSGNGLYYSPSNPFIAGDADNKRIPDANGYPFSVTQYTNDQTGRVKSQGGVGQEFQIGKANGTSGHSTRYFYSKPTQRELYRLFGKEAGRSTHYLKNMVVDPNNQVSFSYLDASGRTIATSLGGITPANLYPLASNVPAPVKDIEELVDSKVLVYDRDKYTISFSTSFLVSSTGQYKIYYALSPNKLETAFGSGTICNNCYYSVSIKVTDDNGQVKQTLTLPEIQPPFNTDCNTVLVSPNGNFNIDVVDADGLGKYNIEYVVQVSKSALEFYWEDFKTRNTDLKTLAAFKKEYAKNADLSGCYTDCNSCLTGLGDVTAFENAVKAAFAAESIPFVLPQDHDWVVALYGSLKAQCQALPCPPVSPCESFLSQILADVTPGGQYALYDNVTYSFLELPINILAKRTGLTFLNENGETDYIIMDDGTTIQPSQLSDAEFIKRFKPSWANALAVFHPEYCMYLYCKNVNSAGATFSQHLINDLPKASDAEAENLFFNSGVTALINADPFFNGGPGQSFKTEALAKFNNYFTDPHTLTQKNIKQYIDLTLYCISDFPNYPVCDPPLEQCRNKDMEWTALKIAYLSLKSTYEEKARKLTPGYQNCANCFIGPPDLDTWRLDQNIASRIVAPLFSPDAGLDQKAILAKKKVELKKEKSRKYAFSANPYRIIPKNKIAGLPENIRKKLRKYKTFRTIETDKLTGRSATRYLKNVSVLFTKATPDSMSAFDAYLVDKSNAKFDTTSAIARSLVQPMATMDCNAPNAWVTDYYTGIPVYMTCMPAVGCQYYEYYYLYDENFNFIEYFNVYVCDNEPAACPLGYYTLSTGEEVYISTDGNPPPGYVCVESFQTLPITTNTGMSCVFNEVWLCQKIPPVNCSQLSVSTNVVAGCDGDSTYTRINVNLPQPTSVYVSVTISVLGTAPGQTGVAFLGSHRVTIAPNTTNAYFCLPLKLSGYQNVQIKQGALSCNTCSEGQYSLNGKDVSVSFDGNKPPSPSYGNCKFYPTIRVKTPTGDSCTLNNVTICEKITYVSPCLEAENLVLDVFESNCDVDYGVYCPISENYVTEARSYGYYTITLPQTFIVPVTVYYSQTIKYVESGVNRMSYPVNYNCDDVRESTYTFSHTFMPGETVFGDVLMPSIVSGTTCVPTVVTIDRIECPPSGYGNCVLPPNVLLYKDKRRVFLVMPDMSGMTGAFNGTPQGNQQASTEFIKEKTKESCEQQADTWVDKLQTCVGITEFQKTQLRNAFVAICERSADASHIQGARNVPQGISLPYNSFKDAIVGILGAGALNNLCNDLLIEAPYPYDKQPLLGTPKPLTSRKDVPACVLANILQWNNQYLATPGSYLTLADYIRGEATQTINGAQYKLGDVFKMSNEDLQVLISAASSNCIYLARGVAIPPYMQCDQVLTFTQYQSLKQQFSVAYPYALVAQNNYWRLLATYINHQTGGSFTASNVEDFDGAGATNQLLAYDYFSDQRKYSSYACLNDVIKSAVIRAVNDYRVYIEEQRLLFYKRYTDKCLEMVPSMQMEVDIREYHFTLYYYDQSGSLVKTVPPEGVSLLTEAQVDQLMQNRNANVPTNHTLSTVYKYNSLKGVTWQQTPDGGAAQFWYDGLGRMVASQNDVQKDKNAYSYTIYDEQGRIVEVGEKTGPAVQLRPSDDLLHILGNPHLVLTNHGSPSIDKYEASLSVTLDAGFSTEGDNNLLVQIVETPVNDVLLQEFYISGVNDQVTKTYYDEQGILATNIGEQQNLRKRVASSAYLENVSGTLVLRSATHYSYDVSGNAKTVWQENRKWGSVSPTNQFKKIDYEFDLVSGKVNRLWYQRDKTDAFLHQYLYDAENRLIETHTSRDGFVLRREAGYSYFLHGPLKRMELGDVKNNGLVQGVDYTYTLQGWLKSINGQKPGAEFDPGGDGYATHPFHKTLPADVLSYTLGYYSQDYTPIGTSNSFVEYQAPVSLSTGNGLFNGNISHTTVALNKLSGGGLKAYTYGYDQLNRLLEMRHHAITTLGSPWSNSNIDGNADAYKESITYDANGNIKTYLRNGSSTNLAMDNMTYSYYVGTNKLKHVNDPVGSVGLGDIGAQPNPLNYVYDKIGNLVKDESEGVNGITWTVYGKIRSIDKGSGLSYTYDPAGNRISKTVGTDVTYYVRDPEGNPLAVYKQESGATTLSEFHLYGSSRLGMLRPGLNAANIGLYTGVGAEDGIVGSRTYELSNHLGNVMATLSDKKIAVSLNSTSVDHYDSEVLSQNDYYPFGMMMNERKYALGDGYRYGFNGKENDNEIKGTGNQQDYGARIYDPRVARWLSLDPLQKKYPGETPYLFSGANPILYKDPDGKDRIVTVTLLFKSGSVTVQQKVKGEWIYEYGSQSKAWNEVNKWHIVQNLTIDLTGDKPDVKYSYSKDSYGPYASSFSEVMGLNKLGNAIFGSGSEHDQFKVGTMMYGKSSNTEWDDKLPQAANGSDWLKLGDWLDFAGGLRPSESAKDVWDRTTKFAKSKGFEIKEGAKLSAELGDELTKAFEGVMSALSAVENKDKTSKKEVIHCRACGLNYRDSSGQYVPTQKATKDTTKSHMSD